MKKSVFLLLFPLIYLNVFADREGSTSPEKADPRLEALLDKAFDSEQIRIFKGSDQDQDGVLSAAEFNRLYGEGGAQKFDALFQKHGGKDGSLTLSEFQAVRRAIHLGGAGSSERRPSVENRFRFSKQGKVFRAYDKSGDEQVSLEEYGRMFEGGLNAQKENAFKAADKDGNGSLDKYEFLEMRLGPPLREGPPSKEGARDR
jgi:Ca2+-binding EF-hand superfamily protein